MQEEFVIDLQRPPHERWAFDAVQCEQVRRLADVYMNDIGVPVDLAKDLSDLATTIVPEHYWLEIETLAKRLDTPAASIFICNAYYDLIKSVIGCTAFAIDSARGPLHARNLDWWTKNRLLNETSLACRFVGAPAGEFVSIGWPGFTGVLSGMAPGRFCITLNAVLSNEPLQLALPISYLIRSVFEEVPDFDSAVELLCNAMIPSDCLLLVSGTKAGEMVVIERSPTKHAVRYPNAPSRIVVANEYLLLDDGFGSSSGSELQATSGGRFQSMTKLLNDTPADFDACLGYLSDPSAQMTITVQQMAFCCGSGEYSWRKG